MVFILFFYRDGQALFSTYTEEVFPYITPIVYPVNIREEAPSESFIQ